MRGHPHVHTGAGVSGLLIIISSHSFSSQPVRESGSFIFFHPLPSLLLPPSLFFTPPPSAQFLFLLISFLKFSPLFQDLREHLSHSPYHLHSLPPTTHPAIVDPGGGRVLLLPRYVSCHWLWTGMFLLPTWTPSQPPVSPRSSSLSALEEQSSS